MALVNNFNIEAQKLFLTCETSNDPIFVIDYIYANDKLFGIGFDDNFFPKKIKINVPCGVYFLSKNYKTIYPLLNKYIDFTKTVDCVKENIRITRDCAIFHLVSNDELYNVYNLYFLPLTSFAGLDPISSCIKYSSNVIEMFKISNIYTQILCYNWLQGKTTPILNVKLDSDLNSFEIYNEPKLPIISFDLETISSNAVRVPFGNYRNDILMTASFIERENNGNVFCKLWIYLPAKNDSQKVIMEQQSNEKIKQYIEDYDYKLKFNSIEIRYFFSEKEILSAIFDYFISYPTVFIALGYNIRSYDLYYLAQRATFLNIPEKTYLNFYHNSFSIGTKMIPVDLYLIFAKFYKLEFPSLKLKDVSSHLLKTQTKVDFPAVAYRFIFKDMIESQNINSQYAYKGVSYYWKDIMLYNIIDSVLVLNLWEYLEYDGWIFNLSKIFHIPTRLLYQIKNNRFLGNYFTIESLYRNIAIVKSNYVCHLKVDENIFTYNDQNIYQNKLFSGGFNYRIGQMFFHKIYMVDMLTYYPNLISSFNLSKETTALISKEQFDKISPFVKSWENVRLFKFVNHTKNPNDLPPNVYERLFINGLIENVEEILNVEQIETFNKNDQIIVIIQKSRYEGFLPKLVSVQSDLRSLAKKESKKLEKTIKLLKFDSEYNDTNNIERTDLTNTNLLHGLVKPRTKILSTSELNLLDESAKKKYKYYLEKDYIRIQLMYRSLKIVINSIYGLTGCSFSFLESYTVSSITTAFGRKYIIETAKCARDFGFEVVFSDTDSTFLFPIKISANIEAVKRHMLNIDKCLILNDKVYQNVLILGKKLYIATKDSDILSKGINKNGPKIWTHFLFDCYTTFICKRKFERLQLQDISDYLKLMYEQTYHEIEKDNETIFLELRCKDEISDYLTDTATCMYLKRQKEENAEFVPDKKIKIFYKFNNNPKSTVYENYQKYENSSMVNLYKFYSSITTQMYKIFLTAIGRYYKKESLDFFLPFETFNLINIDAFLSTRTKICKIETIDTTIQDTKRKMSKILKQKEAKGSKLLEHIDKEMEDDKTTCEFTRDDLLNQDDTNTTSGKKAKKRDAENPKLIKSKKIKLNNNDMIDQYPIETNNSLEDTIDDKQELININNLEPKTNKKIDSIEIKPKRKIQSELKSNAKKQKIEPKIKFSKNHDELYELFN